MFQAYTLNTAHMASYINLPQPLPSLGLQIQTYSSQALVSGYNVSEPLILVVFQTAWTRAWLTCVYKTLPYVAETWSQARKVNIPYFVRPLTQDVERPSLYPLLSN